MTVYTLLVVLLAGNGSPGSYSRDFPTDQDCQAAAEAAHDAAERALGVLDVGTLCVRSEFKPNVKPRA